MAKIKKSYCLEMDKIVDSSQARVAYLSEENIYDEFHFYCIGCGIKLSSVNIMKRQELTRKNKTSHFKLFPDGVHLNPKCVHLNPEEINGRQAKSASSIPTPNTIIYNKFKLSQIDYEIKRDVDESNIPEVLDTAIIDQAEESHIDADIYTTSVFQDIIECYEELKSKDIEANTVLNIENDFINNTYGSVFNTFDDFNSNKKLHKQNENFFKYRILYGKIKNNKIGNLESDWNFVIELDSTYWLELEKEVEKEGKKEIKKEYKPVIIRVIIEDQILDLNPHLKQTYLDYDSEGKILSECYIVNTTPSLEEVRNKNNDNYHYELVFNVQNLNHLHISFRDSNDQSTNN